MALDGELINLDSVKLKTKLAFDIPVTAKDVFNAMSQGMRRKDIRQSFKISAKQLQKAEAFILSAHPELAFILNPPKNQLYHMLVDANITPTILNFMLHGQGFSVSHVNCKDLKDASDAKIFQKARSSQIDCILTLDRRDKSANDLTRIAKKAVIDVFEDKTIDSEERFRQLQSLPILIQVDMRSSVKKKEARREIVRAFQKFHKQIKASIQNKLGPVTVISGKGVEIPYTFQDVYDDYQLKGKAERRSRLDATQEKVEKRLISALVMRGQSREMINSDKDKIRSLAWQAARRICAAPL